MQYDVTAESEVVLLLLLLPLPHKCDRLVVVVVIVVVLLRLLLLLLLNPHSPLPKPLFIPALDTCTWFRALVASTSILPQTCRF